MKIQWLAFGILALTLTACGKYTNPVIARGDGTAESSPITVGDPMINLSIDDQNLDSVKFNHVVAADDLNNGKLNLQLCLKGTTDTCVLVSGTPTTALSTDQKNELSQVGLENCEGTLLAFTCAKNQSQRTNLAYSIQLISLFEQSDGKISTASQASLSAHYRYLADNSGHSSPPPHNRGRTPALIARCVAQPQGKPCFTPKKAHARFWNSTIRIDAIEYGDEIIADGQSQFYIQGQDASSMIVPLNLYLKNKLGFEVSPTTERPLARHEIAYLTPYLKKPLKRVWFTYITGGGIGSTVEWNWIGIKGR